MGTKQRKNSRIFLIIFIIIALSYSLLKLFITTNTNNIRTKIDEALALKLFTTVTKEMNNTNWDNINLYYNKNDEFGEEFNVNYVKSLIKRGEKEAIKVLGETSIYPLDIILLSSSKEFSKKIKYIPGNIDAFYVDEAIYIPIDILGPHSFVHEYSHHKIYSFCKDNEINSDNIPIWFHEGLAEYISSPLYESYFKSISVNEIVEFRKMNTNENLEKESISRNNLYTQGYLAINKIIDLKGEYVIQDILKGTKTTDFYESFEKNIGMTVENLEELLK